MSLLNQSALVERWTSRVPDANFLLTPSWATVNAAEPCNIQERGFREMPVAGGKTATYNAVGYFSLTADLKPDAADPSHGDRVTVSGKVYHVVAIIDQVGKGRGFLKAYLRSV